jgi:small subunit ribosomal protein S17
VISDKMDKTVVIMVETLRQHPRYKKYIKYRKKFKAHDKDNACKIGDVVRIEETRPLSREKRWRVLEILEREGKKMVPEVELSEELSLRSEE